MSENKTNTEFNHLFEKYYPGLLFYATQFLCEDEARDVVQDVFMDLWNKKDTVTIGDKIQAYLYRMVYSHCINVLNHKKVESKYADAFIELHEHKAEFFELETSNDAVRKLEDKEISSEIDAAINTLPEKCREVFKLSYLHNLKNKEIAEIMDISLRTVETHRYKAIKLMREKLKYLLSLLIISI
ncbi:MAG: RNA polymerase sigma-70 factor [Candidatus Symbiothrix sp.]|jgi:RNA polymerase sigma-70 factor (ECF subfamily)|nr:RNA polymerase sigma-70 factor [Candidatus Symbiothrix sp.]